MNSVKLGIELLFELHAYIVPVTTGCRPRHLKSTLEAIINEAKSIPANLPNVAALRDAVHKANEWMQRVESIQVTLSLCLGIFDRYEYHLGLSN